MEECVDGEYQDFKSKNGAYVREHFFGKYPETRGAGRRHDRRRDLGADPRRPRPEQGLRRLRTRRSAPRASRPSSSPRPSRATAWARPARARTSPISRRRWARRTCASSATASACRSPTSSSRRSRSSRFAEGSAGGRAISRSAARRSAATCRRGGAKSEPLRDPAALGLRRAAQGDRGPRDLDHHGVRAHPEHAAARQADRQARRADRAGREPHLRHGGHVPPVRHLQPGRPALPAARMPTS